MLCMLVFKYKHVPREHTGAHFVQYICSHKKKVIKIYLRMVRRTNHYLSLLIKLFSNKAQKRTSPRRYLTVLCPDSLLLQYHKVCAINPIISKNPVIPKNPTAFSYCALDNSVGNDHGRLLSAATAAFHLEIFSNAVSLKQHKLGSLLHP